MVPQPPQPPSATRPWGPALSSASGAASRPPVPEPPGGPAVRSAVRLPAGAGEVLAVHVNGLPQVEGVDYFLVARLVVFGRPLIRGGAPSRRRRALAALLGIHVGGDTVDVRYRAGREVRTASGLDIGHC